MLKKFLYFCLGCSFFIPLVVSGKTFIFPFIVPKILLFRSITLLMLGAYILLLIKAREQYKIRFSLIHLFVFLYLISLIISTFTGVDWYRSFWDNHERMMGLFTLVHYILFYFIVSSTIKEGHTWRNFFRLFLFAGALVMCIGIWQKIDPQFLLNRGIRRVASTLGNPIYVGGYGLFLFFLGLFLFLQESKMMWKVYAIVGSLLGLSGVLFSETRGSMLGIIVGVGIMSIAYAFFLKEHKRIQRVAQISLILGVVVLGIFFTLRAINFETENRTLRRLLNTSLESRTVQTRLMAWDIAIEASKEKPLFGWGPNNYYVPFNKYYNPKFLERGYGETWFDNAHNVVMNTLATQGIFGIVSFLGIYITAVLLLWKRYRQGTLNIHVASVSIAFLFAHFIHNFFVFENPTSYLYFFFFLAFIHQQTVQIDERNISEVKGNSVSLPIASVIAILVLFFIFTTNIRSAQANMATLDNIRLMQSDIDAATAGFEEVLASKTPHIDDIRNDFARMATQILQQYIQQGQSEKAVALFQRIDKALEENVALHPFDIRVMMQRAELHQLVARTSNQPQFFQSSYELFDQARELSPKRQQTLFMLGTAALSVDKPELALQWHRQVVEDNPNISEGWWRLAVIHAQLGQQSEALQVISDAVAFGIEFDRRGIQVLSQVGLLDNQTTSVRN